MVRKLLIGAVAVIVVAAAGWAVFVRDTQPDEPGSFYTAPSPLPDGPNGTIIRQEVLDGFHEGATTYRVLYKSTGFDGEPAAVSGLILVPNGEPPPEGRKVVTYSHGTIGVAPSCAPSLQPSSFFSALLPGLDTYLNAGNVVTATDYQGLGTPGPSPYLVGTAEASDVLDSVRAASALDEANTGSDFAVYGESQGGHAALFTGQLAENLAPELNLVGVVAAEPASNLVDLFRASAGNAVGNILTSMALYSWAGVYDAARLQDIVTPVARPLVSRIAGRCIQNPKQILTSIPAATALQVTFLSQPPWETEPWKTILAENTPTGDVGVPLFIPQGLQDHIVPPAVQEQFVEGLCQQGKALDYRTYPGAGHLDLPTIASGDVTKWIADRFAGAPAANTCG